MNVFCLAAQDTTTTILHHRIALNPVVNAGGSLYEAVWGWLSVGVFWVGNDFKTFLGWKKSYAKFQTIHSHSQTPSGWFFL